MKITAIKTSEKGNTNEEKNSALQDYCFYLFRSPVIFKTDGIDKQFPRGCAVLFEGGVSRSFRGVSPNDLHYDYVRFRPSSADKQYIAGLKFPLNKPIETADNYIIASNLKNLHINMQCAGKRKTEICELYMRIILIALEDTVCGAGTEADETDTPRYPQLRAIRRELYDNPNEAMSVDKMCRRLAVSRTYFHRIYLSAFGVTFRQDAIKSRLTYACELLTDTELSVSAVAEKCGYESDSYFMRQFRQHMGCTPSAYRKQRRGE